MTETQPPKVCILEDDAVFGVRLARAFERRGYDVLQVASCREAERFFKSPAVKYAVLDLCLPDGSGVDVLKKLLQTFPGVRAVVLTGYGTISTAVEAIKIGAVEFLTKPTNPDAILAALRGEEVVGAMPLSPPTLAQVEWEHMQRVLADCDGNITKAAQVLGLHRRSLQRKLARDPGRLK